MKRSRRTTRTARCPTNSRARSSVRLPPQPQSFPMPLAHPRPLKRGAPLARCSAARAFVPKGVANVDLLFIIPSHRTEVAAACCCSRLQRAVLVSCVVARVALPVRQLALKRPALPLSKIVSDMPDYYTLDKNARSQAQNALPIPKNVHCLPNDAASFLHVLFCKKGLISNTDNCQKCSQPL